MKAGIGCQGLAETSEEAQFESGSVILRLHCFGMCAFLRVWVLPVVQPPGVDVRNLRACCRAPTALHHVTTTLRDFLKVLEEATAIK